MIGKDILIFPAFKFVRLHPEGASEEEGIPLYCLDWNGFYEDIHRHWQSTHEGDHSIEREVLPPEYEREVANALFFEHRETFEKIAYHAREASRTRSVGMDIPSPSPQMMWPISTVRLLNEAPTVAHVKAAFGLLKLLLYPEGGAQGIPDKRMPYLDQAMMVKFWHPQAEGFTSWKVTGNRVLELAGIPDPFGESAREAANRRMADLFPGRKGFAQAMWKGVREKEQEKEQEK